MSIDHDDNQALLVPVAELSLVVCFRYFSDHAWGRSVRSWWRFMEQLETFILSNKVFLSSEFSNSSLMHCGMTYGPFQGLNNFGDLPTGTTVLCSKTF